MAKDPSDMSVEELEALLAQKKKEEQAKWEKERQDWKKQLTPEAEKYGFSIVDKERKPQKARVVLSDAQKKEVEAMVKKGAKAKELVEKFGVSEPTAYNYITKFK